MECVGVNGYRAGALACLVAAAGLLAFGAASGDVRVGFFFIVPFVTGTGLAPLGAMLFGVAAFVLWNMGALRTREPPAAPDSASQPPRRVAEDEEGSVKARSRSGGVVLLGPIPIVWGSDRRVLAWMVAAGFALLLLGLALSR